MPLQVGDRVRYDNRQTGTVTAVDARVTGTMIDVQPDSMASGSVRIPEGNATLIPPAPPPAGAAAG